MARTRRFTGQQNYSVEQAKARVADLRSQGHRLNDAYENLDFLDEDGSLHRRAKTIKKELEALRQAFPNEGSMSYVVGPTR